MHGIRMCIDATKFFHKQKYIFFPVFFNFFLIFFGAPGRGSYIYRVKLKVMTAQKYYYTYSFINSQTKEYVGWNSEVASSEDEAIDQAIARYMDEADENTDYTIDTNSFVRQTDEEMYALMNFSL